MIPPPKFTSTTTAPTPSVVPIFKAEDKSLAVDTHRRNSVRRGVSTGWATLDEYMSVKRGAPLFVAGSPHAGKSQFTKALLVNLSKIHGWRHCVYLGEEGEVRDLCLDFVELYVGKSARMKNDDGSENDEAMSEAEFGAAFMWVNEHFAFVSPDEADVGAFDIATFYSWVKAFEDETGMKFDTTVETLERLGRGPPLQRRTRKTLLADALKTVRTLQQQQPRRHCRHLSPRPTPSTSPTRASGSPLPRSRTNGRAAKLGSDVPSSCSSCTDLPRRTPSALGSSRPRPSSAKRGSLCKRPSPAALVRSVCAA